MLALLPKTHRLAKRKKIRLQEIADEPYILLEEGHFSEPIEAFKNSNIKPDIRYTIHDDYAIMTMVEAGLGISILAELVLKRTQYNIAAVPIAPPITRTIAIGFKDKNSIPIASKRFIKYLVKNIENLP